MDFSFKYYKLAPGLAQTFPFRRFFLCGNDLLESAKGALDNKLETEKGRETDERLCTGEPARNDR